MKQAAQLESRFVRPTSNKEEHQSERRLFLLQIVQPDVAGFMDGSVRLWRHSLAAALAQGSEVGRHCSWPRRCARRGIIDGSRKPCLTTAHSPDARRYCVASVCGS